jgi:hypothetical protein
MVLINELNVSAKLCTRDNKDNPVEVLNIKYNFECTESYARSKVLNQFNGRTSPVADIGDCIGRTLNISFVIKNEEDYYKLLRLENTDKILFYEDKRGRSLYCTIAPNSFKIQNRKQKLYSISLDLTEVDTTEEA